MSTINIQKSDGTLEPLNLGKILRWAAWAAHDCDSISLEDLLTTSSTSFYEGVSTNDITLAICKNCEDLSFISAEEKNFKEVNQYFKIARNLYIPNILKKANTTLRSNILKEDIEVISEGFKISDHNIVPLTRYSIKSLLKTGVRLGLYDKDLLDGSLHEELFKYAEEIIDYSLMDLLFFNGLRQMEEKYLTKHKGNLLEDPQQHFILIALALTHSDAQTYSKGNTLEFQKESLLNYYRIQAKGESNNPTPFSVSIRTPHKQYDSCCLFSTEDDLKSIGITNYTAKQATGAGAGIGVSFGRIRAKGTTYKKKGKHDGLFGFLKEFSSNISSASQVSRGGSATVNFPMWHRDYYDLVMLKDNTGGVEGENRLRGLDYSFHYSKYLVNKLKTNEKILLVSPHVKIPSGKTVYEAFYNTDENGMYDDKEFIDFCESILANDSLDIPHINSINSATQKPGYFAWTTAYEFFSTFVNQAFSVGRLYTLNVNNVNDFSSFLDIIEMSNLCHEITEPTTPLEITYDSKDHLFGTPNPNSETAFCQLGAVALGNHVTKEDLKRICYWIIRYQEAVFNISNYSVIPFSNRQKKRRNIGIGVVNFHHMLVREVFSKFPESEWERQTAISSHQWAEAIQYWLLDASIELAKELGTPELFDRSTYSKNILPIDKWVENDLTKDIPLLCDWVTLREKGRKYGYRMSTHTTGMPVESSSVTFSNINSFEGPKSPVTYKGNKKLTTAVMVPEIEEYGDNYFYVWDNRSVSFNTIYRVALVNLQKFFDQSLSYNGYFDVSGGKKISEEEALKFLFIYPCKYGTKTTYYLNFLRDDDNEKESSVKDVKVNLSEEMTEEEKQFYSKLKELKEADEPCEGCVL